MCRRWFGPSSCVWLRCGSSSPPSTPPAAPCSTQDGSPSSLLWSSAGVCVCVFSLLKEKEQLSRVCTSQRLVCMMTHPLNKLRHPSTYTLRSPWAWRPYRGASRKQITVPLSLSPLNNQCCWYYRPTQAVIEEGELGCEQLKNPSFSLSSTAMKDFSSSSREAHKSTVHIT